VRQILALPWRALGQAMVCVLVAAPLAYCSVAPRYEALAADQGIISLSLSYAGPTKERCEPLSPEELAQLPANMRRPRNCPRERWPIMVELIVDGQTLHAATHAPAGLWNDGPSTVYQRFAVPAGTKAVTVRLRNAGRAEGYDFERTASLELKPRQNLVIDFRADAGGFSFR
jgi:hypothetical protein